MNRKRLFIATVLLCLTSLSGFSQLQVGGGPAYFLNVGFQEMQYSSIDYSLFANYSFRKFDVGLEFVQNEYRDNGWGKKYNEFYQYQFFGRFYPFKHRSFFLKTGINYTDEKFYDSVTWNDSLYNFTDHEQMLGIEGGLGFQDRLIKKSNFFFNVSLSYNYLKILRAIYVDSSHENPMPFYALKASLIYQFDFKKKPTK